METSNNTGLCIPYTIGITPDKGRGIYTDAAIPKGTIVWRHVPGQYIVYDERSLKELLINSSHSEAVYELTHIFGMYEFPGYMIRVLDDGVLINHSHQPTTVVNRISEEHDGPPIISIQDVVDALLNDRFALVTTRDLKVGDELTHNYDTDVDDPLYYDTLCEQYNVSWEWL